MIEKLIERTLDYGPVGLVAVVIAVAVVWLVRVVRRDVVLPLVASHLTLIAALKRYLPQQQKELRKQTRSLHRIEKNGCGKVACQTEPKSPAA